MFCGVSRMSLDEGMDAEPGQRLPQPILVRIPVDRDRAFRFNVTEDSEFA
jgi:hypothetical protein